MLYACQSKIPEPNQANMGYAPEIIHASSKFSTNSTHMLNRKMSTETARQQKSLGFDFHIDVKII